MPQTLTTSQLKGYLDTINSQGVSGALAVYGELYSQGYSYAGWAQGVGSGNSITGQAALDYLRGTALMGLGGDACRNLTSAQVDQIRLDMAKGYINELIKLSDKNNGTVDRDILYKEAKDFHKAVLERYGMGIENWTLNTPMEIIRREGGDAKVERVWELVRDTGGKGIEGLAVSVGLTNTVRAATSSSDAVTRQMATDWTNQVMGPTIWDQMSRFATSFTKAWSKTLGDFAQDFWKTISDFFHGTFNPLINDLFTQALRWTPSPDPLVLDLDGDGIETVGLNGANSVLFDMDVDGSRSATAFSARFSSGRMPRIWNPPSQLRRFRKGTPYKKKKYGRLFYGKISAVDFRRLN